MSLEPRGYSEKLGNRYEGRWVSLQLLRLLNENIRSVTVEAIGNDEDGVDLWIENNDGTRQAQQCKVENTNKADWSIADLNLRGILPTIKRQLERDPNYEFALVSGTPANMLRDLTRSARHSNRKPKDFYRYQVVEISKARKKAFNQFCEYLELDPNKEEDLAKSFDLLLRTHFHLYSDDAQEKDKLRTFASLLVFGEPLTVIAALCQYSEDNIRKTIHADDLRRHLIELGFHPRQLSYDKRLAPAMDGLVTQFDESIGATLIGGRLIPRDETNKILEAINSDDFSGLAILHGPAGQGKSGILFELVKMLREQEVPVLPIRLDRKMPSNNTAQYGQDIGLPESPVKCLIELAGNRQSVLILDQLDALRWTSSHSSNALDVCKTLIREARTLRDFGHQVSVVISCRTFDLENDPGIKEMLHDKYGKCLRFQIGVLSEETIKEVVENHEAKYSQLSERQKSLLSIAQNLAMWVAIRETEENATIEFETSTQLMRRFWENRYRELGKQGIADSDVDAFITKLVGHMESKGELWAPENIARRPSKVSDLVHSCGIIQTSNSRITFCHQSYLDFQIADRLLREIHDGVGTVREWLGSKDKQSLFRRGQLRQVLFLQIDSNPNEFEKVVRELVDDLGIRFHLKHLILSVIGQIRQPWDSLLDFTTYLLQTPEWTEHVLGLVYLRHSQYGKPLIKRGIINEWLDSSDETKVNSALWLVWSINESCGDLTAELLRPYIKKTGEWPRWVLNTLCFYPHQNSDKMFELRLELAKMGHVAEYVQWPDLVRTHPTRAVLLIEAVISTSDSLNRAQASQDRHQGPRFERWRTEDVMALKKVASADPELVWDMLMPHIERLTTLKSDENQLVIEEWYESSFDFDRNDGMKKGLVEIICVAGKELATTLPKKFLAKTQQLRESSSPITQQILIETYAELPPSFADEAVKWFLVDKSRFCVGSGNLEPEWMPAVRFVKMLSPACSDDCFRQLEDALVQYHSEKEKDLAEYWLEESRTGRYGIWFGKAQYFLLPALCSKRICSQTENLIRALKRKFSDYSESDFLGSSRLSGGMFVSPIKNPNKLSDEAWLGIIANRDIVEDHGPWKQIDSNRVAESSIRQFSNSLRIAASRFPERFAHLANKFPDDVHHLYLAAILNSLNVTEPKDIPDSEKSTWTPASTKSIEVIFQKFGIGQKIITSSAFCRLLLERPDEDWSSRTIEILIKHARNHSDPEPPSGNKIKNASVHALETNALNCVRGEAARAIGALLWKHSNWLEILLPGLESLVRDPHPAVRIAAVEASFPVLQIDKDCAIGLFLEACRNDLRVAACRTAPYFFNSCIKSHFENLSPIINKMLNSNNGEVAREGAVEVCARWLFYGMFQDELTKYCQGTVMHRKGVAQIAAHFLADEAYSSQCCELLLPLFNDVEVEVRAEAKKAFNQRKVLQLADMPAFVLQYISSQAFADDPTNLLYAFDDYPDSLLAYADVIIGICEIFSGPLAEESRSLATGLAHDVSRFSRLILRLYEQSQEVNLPEFAINVLTHGIRCSKIE